MSPSENFLTDALMATLQIPKETHGTLHLSKVKGQRSRSNMSSNLGANMKWLTEEGYEHLLIFHPDLTNDLLRQLILSHLQPEWTQRTNRSTSLHSCLQCLIQNQWLRLHGLGWALQEAGHAGAYHCAPQDRCLTTYPLADPGRPFGGPTPPLSLPPPPFHLPLPFPSPSFPSPPQCNF